MIEIKRHWIPRRETLIRGSEKKIWETVHDMEIAKNGLNCKIVLSSNFAISYLKKKKNLSIPSLQLMFDLTIHFSWSTIVLVSTSDTICNTLSPPQINIVRCDQLHIFVSFKIFKTHVLSRGFHVLIRDILFLSTTDREILKKKYNK